MSASAMKEVLVVGFGAVGALYSYILKKSGLARVTAVARSNYDAVKSTGVTFHSRKYGEIKGWRPDHLTRSIVDAADRPYSYIFVTTKAIPELLTTPNLLKPLLSKPYADRFPQPTYVVIQNGLNVEKDLYNAIIKLNKEKPSVIGTALYIGANLLAPNVVEHNHFDQLSLGVYRDKDYTTMTNSPQEAALLDDLGNILKTGGTTVTIVPEIQRIKFIKNFWNVAFSSMSTLTGYRLPALWRPPPPDALVSYEPFVSPVTARLIEEYTLPSIQATLDELVSLGRAMGFPDSEDGIPASLPQNQVASVKALHIDPASTHTPSMLLDAQLGRPIEVEVIFGEVVRLAREYQVPIPRIETLYGQLLVIQNQIIRKMAQKQ